MLAQSNEDISECDLYSGLHGIQKESLEHLGKQLIQFYHLNVVGFPWKKIWFLSFTDQLHNKGMKGEARSMDISCACFS